MIKEKKIQKKQQKPILIQVAMEVECQELLTNLNDIIKKEIKGYQFYEGTKKEYPIVICLSKVGLIQASAAVTVAIQYYNPIAVINIGIAGATTKKIHTKDIVIGESCININSYQTPKAKEKEGSNPNNWELLTFLSGAKDKLIIQNANTTLINLTKEMPIAESNKIYFGRIGSGDAWNREADRLLFLNEKYTILCEDMEAIAIYTLANQWNIPVISLKMISDNTLIGEEYNRQVGTDIQIYTLLYIEKLIEKIIHNQFN